MRDEIIKNVKGAFADRRRPLTFASADIADEVDENEVNILQELGEDDLRLKELDGTIFFAWGFLAFDAFSYFLPKVIIASIEEGIYDSMTIDFVLRELTGGPNSDKGIDLWDDSFWGRWAQLTDREIAVVQEWLDWLGERSTFEAPNDPNALRVKRAKEALDYIVNNRDRGVIVL